MKHHNNVCLQVLLCGFRSSRLGMWLLGYGNQGLEWTYIVCTYELSYNLRRFVYILLSNNTVGGEFFMLKDRTLFLYSYTFTLPKC